jgi:hypothetical protein
VHVTPWTIATPDRWRGPNRLADTAAMPKQPRKPQSPPLIGWDIYKAAAKAKLIGTVESADEAEAIERGAKEFGVMASKLMAVRRRLR